MDTFMFLLIVLIVALSSAARIQHRPDHGFVIRIERDEPEPTTGCLGPLVLAGIAFLVLLALFGQQV